MDPHFFTSWIRIRIWKAAGSGSAKNECRSRALVGVGTGAALSVLFFSRSGLRNAIPTSYFLWSLIRLFILINPYQKFNFRLKNLLLWKLDSYFLFLGGRILPTEKIFFVSQPICLPFSINFCYIPRSNQGSLSMFVLWITIRKKILSGFSSLTLISSY